MSTRPPKHGLWPTLRLLRFGRLDWPVMPYESQPIAALGKQLQAAPQRPLDWAIGQLLRDLAQTPTALKSLNRIPKNAPRDTRLLNVAVHCLALIRLKEEPGIAHSAVGIAWRMRTPSVKDAHVEFGDKAVIELDALVEMCLARGRPHHTAKEVLRDVDTDMRARASLSGFRTPTAKRR